MLKCGIVILTYNDVEWTKKILDVIIPYNIFDGIVVVDNCSTCENMQELSIYNSGNCHVIRSEKNGGYSYGNNYGAKFLINTYDPDILFFSNPDVVFERSVIEKILKMFESTDYSVLSGVMLDAQGHVDHTTFWNHPDYWEELLSCFRLYRKFHRHSMYEEIDYTQEILDVDVLTGAFFGVRAREFAEIGMFDENVFLYSEENILGKKISTHGMKEGLITGICYTHYENKIINNNIGAVKRHQQQMQSKLYYFKEYCACRGFKYWMMRICMGLRIQEYRLIDFFYGVFKK